MLGKNSESELVKYNICIFAFQKLFQENPNLSGQDYANMLKNLLLLYCTTYNFNSGKIEAQAQESFNKAWNAQQKKQSQQQSRKEESRKSYEHTTPPDPLDAAYKTFGFKKGVPFDKVKKRYKELRKQHHSDYVRGRYAPLIDAEKDTKKKKQLEADRDAAVKKADDMFKNITGAFDIIQATQPSNV